MGDDRQGDGVVVQPALTAVPVLGQNLLQGELRRGAAMSIQFVVPILRHRAFVLFLGCGFLTRRAEAYSPRWRTASYSRMAAAALALRELSLPFMGMLTLKSHCWETRRPMPSPSLPMTMAAGPFRSAS